MSILNDKHHEHLEIVSQKEISKQERLLATLKCKRGQSVWELDLKANTIQKATFESLDINIWEGLAGKIHKKVIRKPDHWYCVALNFTNAKKKFEAEIVRKVTIKMPKVQ